MDGYGYRLRPILHPKFRKDVLYVDFGGFFRYVQCVRDFFVLLTLGEQFQYLDFPVG
jgi:hypothetical protein